MLSRLVVALLLAAFGLLTGCAQDRPAPKTQAAQTAKDAGDKSANSSAADDASQNDDNVDEEVDEGEDQDDEGDNGGEDDDGDDLTGSKNDLISTLLGMASGGGLGGLDLSMLEGLGLDPSLLSQLLSGGSGDGNQLEGLLKALPVAQLQDILSQASVSVED